MKYPKTRILITAILSAITFIFLYSA